MTDTRVPFWSACYPPPPPGHTFRRPHVRGEGDPVARPIRCRGLQVARILLGD